MNSLTKYLVEGILLEEETGITVLLPGGFKPPHGGHLELAKRYASQPNVSKVEILIGPKEREGITREQSVNVWKTLLAGNPNIEVKSVAEDNPLLAAYKYIETAKPGTYALAASNKGEDYERVKKFVQGHAKGAKYYKAGVNVVELPINTQPILYKGRTDNLNGKGVSASVLRGDIRNKDYANFKTNYPSVADATLKAIFSVLTKSNLYEGKLRAFDFDDTLVKTNNIIHVTKADGRQLALNPAEYAMYEAEPGDSYNFSDFDSPIKDATELKRYTDIMRRILKSPGTDRRTVVLTARGNPKVVYDFLMNLGIRVPVIAVGSSDPMKKAAWIEDQSSQ